MNVNPAGIRAVYDGWNTAQGTGLQSRADAIRTIFQAQPMIPAMKRVVAEFARSADWRVVRPPLLTLDDAEATMLLDQLRAVDFDMRGYPVADGVQRAPRERALT